MRDRPSRPVRRPPVQSFATFATNLVLPDVTKGRLTHLVLVTFKGAKAKLWQIHDPPPHQVDDVMRSIAKREAADGLAFVCPMPVPREVDADRSYNVSAESAAGKFDSLIALKGGSGLGGDQFRIYGRKVGDVGPRWFGVDPETEVDLWMEGVVGAVIPGGQA